MPALSALRQQIDELAARLVLGGSEQWSLELAKLAEAASREDVPAVADAIGELAAALEGAGDRTTEILQSGIGHLQQLLTDGPAAAPAPSLAQDPELLHDFVLESREHLASIEAQLLTLERDPSNAEALHATFRGFHTIKGLAGFLELWEVQKTAHEVETVLDRARNSEWILGPAAIDVILQSADYLQRWLAHLEGSQQSASPPPDGQLLARIRGLGNSPSESPSPSVSLAALSEVVESAGGTEAPVPDSASPVVATRVGQPHAGSVKVDTAKLDYLVDMAGEMVIAESLVRHNPELAGLQSPGLQRQIAQLTRVTAELQRTAMAMRLVPIGPLFRRMARLVRDLARQFGKQVEMETHGDEVELDRTIVEELSDPLMHMVRNAVDHGIETPAERREAGKDPVARLLLKAQHRAGQVVIEIADDGRGLDRSRIRAKAVERGLLDPSAELSDADTHNLIFEPGFSTASQVTNVSGRGVGMDVVRRHIERLRGRVEIRSAPGTGTSFSLKLPLTLAIIEGLVVRVGAERYIVPLFAVREMFRPAADTIWTVQQRSEMALVRGTLLPVVRLYRRFAVPPRSEDPLASVLIIAEFESERFGLLVDDLIGKQEVVIKSLGDTFANIPGIAGGAILGDGRVGLILDLEQLFRDGRYEPGR